MFIYVNASLVNCIGWQRPQDRKFAHVWLASPLVIIRCTAATCINDLIKTAKEWQKATVLKNASSSQLGAACNSPEGKKMGQRKRGIHSGAMTRAGFSDAAYRDQSSLGKYRLGYVIGHTSSTLSAPCHIIQ